VYAPSEFNVTLHGETYHIRIKGTGQAGDGQRPFYVHVDGVAEEVLLEALDEVEVTPWRSAPRKTSGKKADAAGGKSRPRPTHAGCVTTAMPGAIVDVKVKLGDKIKAGDGVLVIEAMKMENEVQAPVTGTSSRSMSPRATRSRRIRCWWKFNRKRTCAASGVDATSPFTLHPSPLASSPFAFSRFTLHPDAACNSSSPPLPPTALLGAWAFRSRSQHPMSTKRR
jgi:biotin carboxyl carrier protein